MAWGPITVEGRVPPPGEIFINADQRIVGGRYFETMGIRLLGGRLFNETDTTDTQRVVIVDEFMAKELWPGVDAVGKRIRFGDLKSTAPWQTVVGVVARVKQYGLDTDGRIAVYLPQTQAPTRAMYVTVRSSMEADSVATAIRQQVRELDPNLPIYRLRTMTSVVGLSMATQKFAMQILGVFALVALALAAIGIQAVMAHVVAQGTREIGIRLALGASSHGILSLVLRHGLAVAAIGIAAGLGGAAALTRLMRTLVFGVGTIDLVTYAAVAVLLGFIAVLATLVPAIRASRVDPVVSLRND
jgi:predicted permease